MLLAYHSYAITHSFPICFHHYRVSVTKCLALAFQEKDRMNEATDSKGQVKIFICIPKYSLRIKSPLDYVTLIQ